MLSLEKGWSCHQGIPVIVKEAEMKVIGMVEIPKEPITNPIFTGTHVTTQVLSLDSQDFVVNIVNFGKGVRNKFHSHSTEQLLFVTSGKGIVATEKEERVVTQGDVIIFYAGEKHWHGATADSEFSHIYVTKVGSILTPLE